MDDLLLLRQLHDDIPPPTTEAISAARSRLDEAVGAARRSPSAERTGALPSWRPPRSGRPQTPRRPRRLLRLALAGGLALALAAGIALALQPGARPRGPGTARLAAWTVTKNPDGVLTVHLRQLRDPQGLRRLLRQDGVRARIRFLHHDFEPTTSQDVIPRMCKPLPLSDEANAHLQEKIFGKLFYDPVRGTFTFHTSAIPAGVGLFWEVWASKSAPGAFSMNEDLVQVTRRCTGL